MSLFDICDLVHVHVHETIHEFFFLKFLVQLQCAASVQQLQHQFMHWMENIEELNRKKGIQYQESSILLIIMIVLAFINPWTDDFSFLPWIFQNYATAEDAVECFCIQGQKVKSTFLTFVSISANEDIAFQEQLSDGKNSMMSY